MKKHIAFLVLFSLLGTLSWAQGTRSALFDVRKSQQELEIMKGILSTTLSFISQNMQTASTPENASAGVYARVLTGWRYSNINGFYLAGQGAVFVIPSSGFRFGNFEGALAGVYRDQARLQEEMAVVQERAQAQARAVERSAREAQAVAKASAGAAVAAPPKTAKPPTPPNPPTPATQEELLQNQKELSKRLAELQEKSIRSQQDAEARRAKMLETLEQVKGFLIEALANHGDSITTVKPDEFINIVIMTDDLPGTELLGDTATRTHEAIISVQKSWITDYKAGRMTLDAFKQKALQYEQ